MNEVQSVTEIAKGVSDYGALVIIGSVYIILSALMMVAVFKWFKSIINKIVENDSKHMQKLMEKTDAQNDLLNDIADGLRPATLLQIKSIANTGFDLSIEKVCRIIKKVREENHIADREATEEKIRGLLKNLHNDRNSRFDNTRYRGHSLTHYVSDKWIDWVFNVVVREVYSETENEARTYTNVDAVYSSIKYDFYRRLND